jgi:hypothetical protein
LDRGRVAIEVNSVRNGRVGILAVPTLPRFAPLLAVVMLLGAVRAPVALALFSDTETVPATFAAAASFTGTIYYLHNNPTPPTANTNAQTNLSMNATAPTAATLFNYDANRDSSAGLLILRGGSGAAESDLTQYQNWRGPTLPLGTNISGTVTIEFWSGMKSFTPGVAGQVDVYLRVFDPLLGIVSTELGSASVSAADWQGGASAWVKRIASIPVASTTLNCLTGCRLEIKLEVGASAADDMWLAYDTRLYRSRVRLP